MSKKILLLFWAFFVITHLINILQFPIFEDEAEYLLLAQQIFNDPVRNFFIYTFSGLLPFYGWLVAIVMIFIPDSLLAGRVLNILLASTLIFWIDMAASLYEFNKRFRYIGITLLITSPILFLNTRVVLLDTPMLVFTAWYIYFTAKLLKKPESRYEYLGLFLALLGAFLTKATAIFGVPAIIYLFLRARGDNKSKINFKKILGIYFFVIILLVIVVIFYGKPIISDSGSSSSTFLGIDGILDRIKLNLRLTWIWSLIYFGQFLLFLPFLYKLRKKKINELYVIMGIWAITSVLFMVTLNRFYYPRHILSLSMPLIVIGAGILSEIPLRFGLLILFIMIIFKASNNYYILFNYQKANLAQEDRVSYFEEYTAGTRVNDVANKIDSLSKTELITVWIDGSWTLEYGLRRELGNNENIKFLSYRLGDKFVAHDVEPIYKDGNRKTYAVVNRFQPPTKKNLELVEDFKISFRQTIQIYRVN